MGRLVSIPKSICLIRLSLLTMESHHKETCIVITLQQSSTSPDTQTITANKPQRHHQTHHSLFTPSNIHTVFRNTEHKKTQAPPHCPNINESMKSNRLILLVSIYTFRLVAKRQLDASISHFIEAGVTVKALDAAMAAKQYRKALQVTIYWVGWDGGRLKLICDSYWKYWIVYNIITNN